MTQTALQGITLERPAVDFDTYDCLEPFGLAPEQLGPLFASHLQAAQVVDIIPRSRTRALRPVPADEPEGIVLAYPSAGAGLAMLIARKEPENELISVWPFLSWGTQIQAGVTQILLPPHRLLALIRVTLPDGPAICFQDQQYPASRGFYFEGAVHDFVMVGIAYHMKFSDNTAIRISPDSPNYAVLSQYGAALDGDGNLLIQTQGMAAFLEREDLAPNWYEFRGPVTQVRPYPGGLLGQDLWLVRVTVSRYEEASTSFDLDVAITRRALGDRPLPAVGDDIEGLLFLQGSVWHPDTGIIPSA
ncbi:hypothetical protein [Thalassovita sp.]|uniref:hypothetical protein n=1 Tax=Thalassovita sp. TaxID=1979401 RepID=UPI0029DE8583|nr:hypothetical protein [Thalassovita sp.]